jgi:hypothetical protein
MSLGFAKIIPAMPKTTDLRFPHCWAAETSFFTRHCLAQWIIDGFRARAAVKAALDRAGALALTRCETKPRSTNQASQRKQ